MNLHSALYQQDRSQLMESFCEYIYLLKYDIEHESCLTVLQAEIEDLVEDFNRMIGFNRDGHQDPNSLKVFYSFVERLLKLEQHCSLEKALAGNQVFRAAFTRIKGSDLRTLLRRLEDADCTFDDYHKVFDAVLVSRQWNHEMGEYVTQLLVEEKIPVVAALMIESAMLLASLVAYDPRKSETLLETYLESDNEVIRQRALIGFTLTMPWNSIFAPKMKERLFGDNQCDRVKKELQSLQKQIFLCQQTPQVSADINANIMPDLVNLGRDKFQKMSSNDLEDTSVEEIIDSEMEDRFAAKLDKTMGKMIDKKNAGQDINYVTFSKMKNFAFFRQFSNWFVPFTANHPDLKQIEGCSVENIHSMVSASGFPLCESDKYSLIFVMQGMMQHMPQYKDILKNAPLKMPNDDEMLSQDNNAVLIRRGYLQDLYRFFYLAPMRSGFPNPFAEEGESWVNPSFLSYPIFDEDDFADIHLNVCRFLAKSKEYVKLDHYLQHVRLATDDGNLLQALCLIHVRKRYDEAVVLLKPLFEEHPDRVPVGKLLLNCYMQIGMYHEALSVFDTLHDKLGNQASFLLNKTNCLRQLGLHREALQVAYELDYKYPGNADYMHLLITEQLENDEIQKASEVLSKLPKKVGGEVNTKAIFYFGLIEWCKGNQESAVRSFCDYARLLKLHKKIVLNSMEEIREMVYHYGVSAVDFAIMLNLMNHVMISKD